MDDLGRAMTTEPHMRMLGGGNPAAVPEMQALLRQRMRELLDNGETFDRMLCNYEPPQGNPRFRRALAELLQRSLGWDLGPQNIAVTSGAQSAYFYLFNLLAGGCEGGRRRRFSCRWPRSTSAMPTRDSIRTSSSPAGPALTGRRAGNAGYSSTALTSPPWRRRCNARTSGPSPPRALQTRAATS